MGNQESNTKKANGAAVEAAQIVDIPKTSLLFGQNTNDLKIFSVDVMEKITPLLPYNPKLGIRSKFQQNLRYLLPLDEKTNELLDFEALSAPAPAIPAKEGVEIKRLSVFDQKFFDIWFRFQLRVGSAEMPVDVPSHRCILTARSSMLATALAPPMTKVRSSLSSFGAAAGGNGCNNKLLLQLPQLLHTSEQTAAESFSHSLMHVITYFYAGYVNHDAMIAHHVSPMMTEPSVSPKHQDSPQPTAPQQQKQQTNSGQPEKKQYQSNVVVLTILEVWILATQLQLEQLVAVCRDMLVMEFETVGAKNQNLRSQLAQQTIGNTALLENLRKYSQELHDNVSAMAQAVAGAPAELAAFRAKVPLVDRNQLVSKLSQDLGSLLTSQAQGEVKCISDLDVVCSGSQRNPGGTLGVHRAILAARCTFFREWLLQQPPSSQIDRIELEGCSLIALEAIATYLYTDARDTTRDYPYEIVERCKTYGLFRLQTIYLSYIYTSKINKDICKGIIERGRKDNFELLSSVAITWLGVNYTDEEAARKSLPDDGQDTLLAQVKNVRGWIQPARYFARCKPIGVVSPAKPLASPREQDLQASLHKPAPTNLHFRLLVLGATQAGKSTWCQHIVDPSTPFQEQYSKTEDFSVFRGQGNCDKRNFSFELVDTAGSKQLESISRLHEANTVPTGLVLIFSMTDQRSFNDIDWYIDFLLNSDYVPTARKGDAAKAKGKRLRTLAFPTFVVATKRDQVIERQVSVEDALEFCQTHEVDSMRKKIKTSPRLKTPKLSGGKVRHKGLPFFETSLKHNILVSECWQEIVREMHHHYNSVQ